MFFNRKFRYEAAGYEESHIRLFFAKVSGRVNNSTHLYAGNRLKEYNGTEYTYDALGNLIYRQLPNGENQYFVYDTDALYWRNNPYEDAVRNDTSGRPLHLLPYAACRLPST